MGILDRFSAALAPRTDARTQDTQIAELQERLARHESAALERQQLLQAVIDAAPVAIVLFDELGTIVFANAGARELLFDEAPPEGSNFLGMLSRVPDPLRNALLSDADHIFSFESGGESETYHLSKRHLTLGARPHSVLILRHMTLEQSRQENAVLRKAIRVIHHEFANSLAPVISLLKSARGRLALLSAEPKLEQMLSVIEQRVLHINVFLTGFAALGRLPKPRQQEVSWETFLSPLRSLLPDITIAAAPAGTGWLDAMQVQQVILNLVKNAQEAGSDPREIELEVAPAADGGSRLSVYDRGTGMNDEALENAVVPSFTTKPNGSGMGLALCREIIVAHHGRLRIARREGGGTAVSFWLPPRETPAAALGRTRAKLTLSRAENGANGAESTAGR